MKCPGWKAWHLECHGGGQWNNTVLPRSVQELFWGVCGLFFNFWDSSGIPVAVHRFILYRAPFFETTHLGIMCMWAKKDHGSLCQEFCMEILRLRDTSMRFPPIAGYPPSKARPLPPPKKKCSIHYAPTLHPQQATMKVLVCTISEDDRRGGPTHELRVLNFTNLLRMKPWAPNPGPTIYPRCTLEGP